MSKAGWGKALRWLGVGAVKVGQAALPVIAPTLGGPLAPAIATGAPLLIELIHGAVSKAQEEHPVAGAGPQRLELAFAKVEPYARVGLYLADALLPGDVNAEGALRDVKQLISAYASLLKNLGLRPNLAAAGLAGGIDGVASQQPGAQAADTQVDSRPPNGTA